MRATMVLYWFWFWLSRRRISPLSSIADQICHDARLEDPRVVHPRPSPCAAQGLHDGAGAPVIDTLRTSSGERE